MLTLGIDSATRTGGVALADGGRVIASRSCPLRLTHSESLLPAIAELFDEAKIPLEQVEGIAAACGPGSFTGLRVGLATARGLALGRKLPVVGVPTMEALALPFRGEDMPIWILLPSRRDHVFAGLFQWGKNGGEWTLDRLHPESNLRVEEFLSELTRPAFLAGPALAEVEEEARTVAGGGIFIDARSHLPSDGSGVAILGERRFLAGEGSSPESLRPMYVVERVAQPLPEFRESDEGEGTD